MTSSLKKLAFQGTAWTVFGYGASQLLRFANNLILTRLLIPEYFGIMAIVNTLHMGLELFSDIGIPQNIVRSERGDDPVFLNTAWSIALLRGLGLWVIFLLLAWPVAYFYQEPLLFPTLLVTSLITPLRGAVSIKLYSLNRHMMLGKLTLLELSTQVIGLSTMIILALIRPTIWALVIGGLVANFYRTLISYVISSGHKHLFRIEAAAKEEIVSFGRWMFVSSIVLFLSDQSDRLILGKLIPLDILGIYSIAYMFANIPQQIMKQMGFKVIFPLVSKQIELPRQQLRRKLSRHRWKLHCVLLLICVILAGFGDLLMEFLYDNRYEQAAWMMPILALGSWFSALFFISSPCVLALGKPLYNAQSRIFRLLIVTFGLLVGFKIAGILGAVVVISLGDLPAYLAIQYYLRKDGLDSIFEDFCSTLILIGTMIVIFAIRQWLGLGLPFDLIPTNSF